MDELQTEVEQLGSQLGRKAIDHLQLKLETKHSTQLEVMRFVCVELWEFVFAHRIDRLSTNSEGVYLLIDEQCRFLSRLSSDAPESPEFKQRAKVFEYYLVGLMKGALTNLGIEPSPTIKLRLKPSAAG